LAKGCNPFLYGSVAGILISLSVIAAGYVRRRRQTVEGAENPNLEPLVAHLRVKSEDSNGNVVETQEPDREDERLKARI